MNNNQASVDGLLLVDKAEGLTSHDVVLMVRRAYGERSIGHLGTLDPFATGLLVLLLGRCTRLATFIDNEPKVYEATIRFGAATDTDDCTGEIIRTTDVIPDLESIKTAIKGLTGDILQIPPIYSAKKVDGKRAYDIARSGEEVELKPSQIHVHNWEILNYGQTLRNVDSDPKDISGSKDSTDPNNISGSRDSTDPNNISGSRDSADPNHISASKETRDSSSYAEMTVRITCGGGTYIRALARDLGEATGSAAHLTALRRIQSGDFHVTDAVTIQQLKEAASLPPVKPLKVVVG